MCVHDSKGAMGMAINNPLPSPDFKEVLHQVGLAGRPIDPKILQTPVLSGGPVQGVNGFLIHSSDFSQKDTIVVDDQFSISGTIDTLRTVISGYRPEKMLFTLGYAGWSAGQLEKELQDNVWLTAPASHEIVFDTPAYDMWEKAFAIIGVSPGTLSGVSGRA